MRLRSAKLSAATAMKELRRRVDRGEFPIAVKPRDCARTAGGCGVVAVLAVFGGFNGLAATLGSVALLLLVVSFVRAKDDYRLDRPDPAEHDARCPSCRNELPAGNPRVIIRGEPYCDDWKCTSVAW